MATENPFFLGGLDQHEVTLKPGFNDTVRDAFNVRIDMYNGPMGGIKKNDPQFRPSMNVRKGYDVKNCKQDPGENIEGEDPIFMGRPRNSCFASGSCTAMGGPLGNGVWDFPLYWATNFPGRALPQEFISTPSRYEVYRYEIDNSHLLSIPSGGGETGHQQCYGGGTPSDTPDRRVLYGAVLNCGQFSISGASGGPYPV